MVSRRTARCARSSSTSKSAPAATCSDAARVACRLREALGLTVPVQRRRAGALPRFEMKASRFVVEA